MLKLQNHSRTPSKLPSFKDSLISHVLKIHLKQLVTLVSFCFSLAKDFDKTNASVPGPTSEAGVVRVSCPIYTTLSISVDYFRE